MLGLKSWAINWALLWSIMLGVAHVFSRLHVSVLWQLPALSPVI
jgi:hypothetical protein